MGSSSVDSVPVVISKYLAQFTMLLSYSILLKKQAPMPRKKGNDKLDTDFRRNLRTDAQIICSDDDSNDTR